MMKTIDISQKLFQSNPFTGKIFNIIKENGAVCENIQDALSAVKAFDKAKREKLHSVFSDMLTKTTDLVSRSYLYDLMVACSVKKSDTAAFIVEELNQDINGERKEEYIWWLCDDLYSLKVKKFEKNYTDFLSREDFGNARQLILSLLGSIKAKDSVPEILKCLENENINGHALEALYKIGYTGDCYIPFLNDSRAWVKKIAEKLR